MMAGKQKGRNRGNERKKGKRGDIIVTGDGGGGGCGGRGFARDVGGAPKVQCH